MTRSDIDLLVDFEDTADFLDLVGLGLFLEERFNQKIDIIPQIIPLIMKILSEI